MPGRTQRRHATQGHQKPGDDPAGEVSAMKDHVPKVKETISQNSQGEDEQKGKTTGMVKEGREVRSQRPGVDDDIHRHEDGS